MIFLALFVLYSLLLFCAFTYETTIALPHPDETFDKTHGLYRLDFKDVHWN
ncbi:MAG: hypothetical protein JWQ79_644 [Mucilaginibacter sp.]|jgi:hypothetical protein|nr:hypothetical protein [Mucilaginibacter sp.]